MMAHCRKFSLKVGVKRSYTPDEAGIDKRGLFSNFAKLEVTRAYGV